MDHIRRQTSYVIKTDHHCINAAHLERERAPDGDDDGPPLKVDGDEEWSLSDVHMVPE